jgi:CheY-like chemotaxis protein
MRRALVIDDEDAVRTVLRRWLQRRGWGVDEAPDGVEALARLTHAETVDQEPYDLVICDLRMPRLSGPELFQWATENHPHVLQRLVFSSGDVDEKGAAAFLATAACPVLEKPFSLTSLAEIVALAERKIEAGA